MEQNTQNTALLVMDVQVGIVGMLPDAGMLISNVAKAIANASGNKKILCYLCSGRLQEGYA